MSESTVVLKAEIWNSKLVFYSDYTYSWFDDYGSQRDLSEWKVCSITGLVQAYHPTAVTPGWLVVSTSEECEFCMYAKEADDLIKLDEAVEAMLSE